MSRHATSLLVLVLVAGGSVLFSQQVKSGVAALQNPVAATPASIAAGKRAYDLNCSGCHGNKAQGSEKAGVVISIIQEQGGKQPPDLTDAAWDHGSSDSEIFGVIKRGVPPTMMAGFDGRIPDAEIWSLVNYLRALAKGDVTVAPATETATTVRPTLELAEYVRMPITAEPTGDNTRAQLARVNFMREEPGGRRFFVNDLNGPLYILDKASKQFTTYLDFNGLDGRPGVYQRFTFQRNFAMGLINVVFDPDYARNGVFYTIHTEDPTTNAPAEPKAGAVAGLDLSAYRTTPAISTPAQPDGRFDREAVIVEWTDRDVTNTTFEGTARELLRLQLSSPIHPLGELTFNPVAKRGDPEWRVMYVGVGDAGTGERPDLRRLNPQRLDNFNGKILRIVPDLREHTDHEHGERERPLPHPQRQSLRVDGRRAQGDLGAAACAIPHRLVWDVDAARPRAPRLLAFNIGLTAWETVVIIKKGANYGYPLREGPQAMTPQGMTAVPADDTIPVQITDTVTRGRMTPTYPVIAYPHSATGGDAIAGGIVYHGDRIPALKGKLLLGDITTGHLWYAEMKDVVSADDGNPTTLAPLHELDANLRRIVEETFRARGGRGDVLPGAAAVAGRGRVDVRVAEDSAGELYLLTKSDGMVRQVMGIK